MRAPADPNLCLRVRHVEQDRQCARLERDCKLADNFNRIAFDRGGKKFANKGFDPCNHFRQLGPIEKWLCDLAVISVVGRIDLEWKLANGADVFLRWNRNPHRSVGTECLPVLRRGAQILVSKDHRHGIALEFVDENTVFAARFTEGIWLAMNRAGHESRGIG